MFLRDEQAVAGEKGPVIQKSQRDLILEHNGTVDCLGNDPTKGALAWIASTTRLQENPLHPAVIVGATTNYSNQFDSTACLNLSTASMWSCGDEKPAPIVLTDRWVAPRLFQADASAAQASGSP